MIKRQLLLKKLSRWLLAIGLVAPPIFFVSLVQAAESEPWRRFYPKDGACSISFPSQPSLVQQSLQVAEGQRLNYDIYLAPFEEKGIFMLLVATYPLPLIRGDEAAGLDGLLKGIVGHHAENKLVSAHVSVFGGYPAMNFLVQSLSNYFRGHAVMAGNTLFLIAMEGRKLELDEKIFSRFLESFKLAEK